MEWNGYKLSERAAAAQLGASPVPRAPMKVSVDAVAYARGRPIGGDPSPMALDSAKLVFAPYQPMPGVLPEGLAMDSCIPAGCGGVGNWASSTPFHEMQGFFGFPYLAELAQRAEYLHACEIWAEHAVRKWIKFVGATKTQRDAVEDEFKRLNVRDVFHTCFLHDQKYGRGQIFTDFNDADNTKELSTPVILNRKKVSPKRPLQRLTTVEPMWSAPGVYATSNPLRPDFYKPTRWFVYGRAVHATRMLTITGRPVSDMLKASYSFGGLSLIQIMKPYVDNWLNGRQSGSDMLSTYSVMNLKTDMSSSMLGGDGQDLYNRVDQFNATRDNRGCMVTDKESEELENIAVPLSGVPQMVAQGQEQMASAARIPLSIYLQITPTGLNATSDGETRNFYADVKGYQEKSGRPAIQWVLDLVCLSLFGEMLPALKFEFEPLWEMSDKDKAEIRKSDAEADVAYCAAGIISNEEARERLANDETSLYHGVDLSGPPPELETADAVDGEETDQAEKV